MSAHHFLLISSNPDQSLRILQASLPSQDELAVTRSAADGIRLVRERHFDAVFFEADPSDEDEIVVCRRLRRDSSAPLILVASRMERDQVTRALNLGADTYIDPATSVREVSARLRALFRRMEPSA